jgi:hypothetical protein
MEVAMSFCEKVESALKLKVSTYSIDGRLIDGTDIGFYMTEDCTSVKGINYIKHKNIIIGVEGELSPEIINLIRIIYDLSLEKPVADFMQPLEYIIKNDVNKESIKGKYLNCNVLYIKANIDIIDILNDIYEGVSYEIVTDDEGVYLVKQMEDIEQEAESIINGICLERGMNVIIGSGRRIAGSYTIKDSAEHAKTACSLAQVLDYREGFYHIDKMVMYGLIYSSEKERIDYYINGGYSGFADVVRDRELIDTAEELFKCHLNISEAARRLYLHRNTLLYRIEKIKNLTGIDIKKFEEAVIFRIVISIYRLKGI